MLARKGRGGITQQRIEPGERPDDHGHNKGEKDEHVVHPFHFIVPGHDLQGHSDKIHLAIQPAHLRALGDIASGPRTPFKQPQDVIRMRSYGRSGPSIQAVVPGMKTHFYALVNFGIDLSARSELSESMETCFFSEPTR